jgi:prepilin-type N-terminal cleavage/methylation domain-containing protein
MTMTHRRGFNLMEMLVATVVMTALLVVLAQFLAAVTQQRRMAARRLLAVEEAANAMEQVAALTPGELTPENLQNVRLSAQGRRSLPQARLTVFVTDEPGPPSGKRIAVELTWQNRAGQTGQPIRLTAWKYE